MAEALRLPRQSRALLAEQLLESLDFGEEFAVSREWLAEIKRRCDELDLGSVTPIPADQVFAQARRALG